MRYFTGLLMLVSLAACSQSGLTATDNSPYAPYGVTRGTTEIDNLTLGHRLMDASEHELALRAFTRAAGHHGLTPEILIGMGSAKLSLGRLHQAEADLRRAVKADPTDPAALNNLGVVLMERGKTTEAAQVFRQAFAFDSGNSQQIRDNLRLALAKVENQSYDTINTETVQLVRRGSADYAITQFP